MDITCDHRSEAPERWGAGEKVRRQQMGTKQKQRKIKKAQWNIAKRQSSDTKKKNRSTHFGILDPGGAPGALLGALLEHHPLHQLAVVDRTTKLLADLRAGSFQQRQAGRRTKSGETSR